MKRTMEIAEIIHLYQDGASTAEIAKLANISARYVRLILKEQNVEKRPFGHWKRQYSLNEDYFKTWSNTMAYILGFFVADGFVGNNAQQIGFAQKERYILEQIRDELGSNQPIYLNKKTGVFMLHINSKVMRQDLITIHNIKPHKSLDVEFPYVPEDYLHHFIRGYFDGDGNVEYRNYTVSFVGGSLNFMVAFKEILKKKGFKPYLRSNNAHYRVIIAGRRTIKLFSIKLGGDNQFHFYLSFVYIISILGN
ncbi:LAGLIDADG family homing endonuclease [Neobacillus sp. LXY-4]|uniref:helix-turn-helix domain-containing protein n=1 Tax=Neobacillus sp. LXY-4 TaxID=3379826 RepID=UPI003EE3AE62